MKTHSRYTLSRKWLMFWTLFIGFGALAGSFGMLSDSSGKAMGMDTMLPYFQVLPLSEYLYQDYRFPGIALLCINGIPNLIAFILLLQKKKSGIVSGGIFGITLMLWICIQFVIFPMNFMSTIYFIFGLCQAITGYMTWIFYKQESFSFQESDYPNIGSNPRQLVVYFSRMGYVRKQAYRLANQTGAQIYEIKAQERTQGTLGFWWCGRFGMHRWAMNIKPISIDLEKYEHVTICSAIWVFSLASPVRSFCQQAKGKIKKVSYVLVHHTSGKYYSVIDEMDQLLGITHQSYTNIQCHAGTYKIR
ncbi:flavodoxin family protein [Floccifex sp.]|uniref:flavodoxin family protein n=1 Tax=Floccifex sp. TaxID=2815810 RepID=UPI003EFEB850